MIHVENTKKIISLEDQCCTLDQGTSLKEFGIIQQSTFYHWSDYDGYGHACINMSQWNNGRSPVCSAFTATELGLMLPHNVKCHRSKSGTWICDEGHSICSSKTEATARAMMVIQLIIKKKLNADVINIILQRGMSKTK